MNLARLFYAQFPDWMRPGHAALRYVLQNERRRRSGVMRWLSWLLVGLCSAALLAISDLAYRAGSPMGMSEPGGSALFTVLYFPLIVLQFVVLVYSLLNVVSLFSSARQREAWEAFKITSHGAEMLIRARWAAVFYQLRGVLALLLGVRVLFAAWMLVELTGNQGRQLDLYITSITPEISITAAILLLAAFLAAALIQVLLLVGLYAALGVWISTLIRRQSMAPFFRLSILVVLVIVFVLAMSGGTFVLDGLPGSSFYGGHRLGRWVGLFALGTLGDQGLRFMDLETFLRAWTEVDYGIVLGAALLGAVVVEVVLTKVVLHWAVRRASHPAQE